MSWQVSKVETEKANAFLVHLCRSIERNQIAMAVPGRAMLNQARRQFDNELAGMVAAGELALATGDNRRAEAIARQIIKVDPDNRKARAFFRATHRTLNVIAVAQSDQKPAPKADDSGDKSLDALLQEIESKGPGSVDAIADVEKKRQIRADFLTQEVNNRINEARLILEENDPDSAMTQLKRALDTVQSNRGDIDNNIYQKLTKQIERELSIVKSEVQQRSLRQVAAARRQAIFEATRLLDDNLRREDEDLQRLLDQVRGLISEGYPRQ